MHPLTLSVLIGVGVLYLVLFIYVSIRLRRGDTNRWTTPNWAVGLIFFALLVAVCMAATLTFESATRALAQTEVQRSADAAALAGQLSLMYRPDDLAAAESEAIRYARLNPVRGRAPDVAVTIDTLEWRLTATLAARAYGVPAPIAWLVGSDRVAVEASATAEGGFSRGNTPGTLPLIRQIRLVR